MGQVYFDMGLLGRPDVHECSASDLVGQYVGQTGPKVVQMFDKALGQVLFIDEAYRLREGPFAQEAIDEIVGLMTQDRYRGKIVVILAGYDEDINQLLEVNRGLASRFPEEICFHNLRPDECIGILAQRLAKDGVRLRGLDQPASQLSQQLSAHFQQLCSFAAWGNARDVLTIAKEMVGVAMDKMGDTDDDVTLEPVDVLACIENALSRFRTRENNQPLRPDRPNFPVQTPSPMTQSAPSIDTKIKTEEPRQEAEPASDGRDPGVSDSVWNQLQLDKAAEEAAEKKMGEELCQAEEELREAERKAQEEREEVLRLAMEIARQRDEEKIQELKRQRELHRLQKKEARRERERLEAELKAKQEAQERARKEEAKAQQKLRDLGVCVAGFRWIKQFGGYRCAGGAHFVSNAQLGI